MADLIHPLSRNRSSIRMIDCYGSVEIHVLNTLPYQIRKMGHEGTTEINSLLIYCSTGISRSYVLTTAFRVAEIKQNNVVELFVCS